MLHLMPCLSWIVVSGTLTSTAPKGTQCAIPDEMLGTWCSGREGALTIPCLEKVTIFDPYQEDHWYHCRIKFLCIEGFQANTHASCRIKFLSASPRGVHKRNSEEAWRVWWTWGAKCPAHGRNMCRVAPACNCCKICRVAQEVWRKQIRDAVIHNMSLFDEYPEGLCTSPCFLENAAGTMRMPSCFFKLISAWFMKPSRLKHGHFHDVWYKHGWMWLELSHPHCHGQNLCGWWIPTTPIGSSCHQQIWLNHTYSTYSIKPFQRWSFCTFCFVAIWIGTCVKPKALWWCEQWSQIFTQWLSGPRKCIQQISEKTVGSKQTHSTLANKSLTFLRC